MKNTKLLIVFLHIALSAMAQFPQRKAGMGMRGQAGNGGIMVDSILPEFTFAAGGIKKGDIILAVNDQPTPTIDDYNAIVTVVRAGSTIKITYLRKGKEKNTLVKAVMQWLP
ncbi:MAG: PDZ domain-containing protein [Flavobacteriia bacterium]|nr:PDZ domain-containing protein [Flavobacteriia bacterium]